MKEIVISRGMKVTVDDEDFESLNQHRWYCVPNKHHTNFYAARNVSLGGKKQKRVWMHRELIKTDMDVDHIDGNGLNNTRSNLRICSRSQNMGNQIKNRNSVSKYKGVCRKRATSWCAQIQFQNKNNHLGYFQKEEDAAKAYDLAAIRLFGEFAVTNFPRDSYL